MGKSSVSDLSEHVFDLIQELFAIDPLLLVSVMPQLEFKLKVTMHIHLLVHQLAYKPFYCKTNLFFCCLFRVMMERRGWLWWNCWLNSLEQKTLNWPLRIAHSGSAFWEGESFLRWKTVLKDRFIKYLSFEGLLNSDFIFIFLPKIQWHPCSCETGVCKVC